MKDINKTKPQPKKESAKLRRRDVELKKHRRHIEELVEERTSKLKAVNEQLQKEITTHKKQVFQTARTEKELKSERDKLQALMDGIDRAGIGIDIVQSDYKIIFQSPSLEKGFGDLRGSICYEHYMGQTEPCEFCPAIISIKNNTVERVELTGTDGRYYEIFTAPLPDPDGIVNKAIEIVVDITKRKQAEEESQKLASVVKYSSELVNLGTLDGKMTFLNEAGSRMLGIDPQEVEQHVIPEVIPESHMDLVEKELLPSLMQGGTWEGELQYKNIKTGKLTDVHAMCFTVKNPKTGAPKFLANVSLDITERKQAERKLNKTLEDLKRSNKELEQFAYVASHDLQEPLRMISSYTQLLEMRYKNKLDSDANDFIHYAVDGSKRMQRLINDLLSYSRVGTRGKSFDPTDCEVVLNQALENLKIAIEKSGANVTYDLLPTLKADDRQLIQLFQNLIDNALKFRGDEPPKIHISASQNGNGWKFSVKDNGMGIDPKHKERIFIIFQRLNKRSDYPGTGIGLAICTRIVDRHGGKIWVKSKTGKGSTFHFTLPK